MRILAVIILSLVLVGCNDNSSTDSNVELDPKIEEPVEKTKENKSSNEQPAMDDIPVELNPKAVLSKRLRTGYLEKSKYDAKIRKEVQRWLPMVHWSIVKAQFYQESKLNPNAESGVGAKGIAQFMPATWEEVRKDLEFGRISRTNADISIMAGTYYDQKLWNFWTSPRPHYHHVAFMLASYNAGAGNLVKAQKACGGPNLFPEVMACLPQITGHHHEETEGYIENIFNFYALHKLN